MKQVFFLLPLIFICTEAFTQDTVRPLIHTFLGNYERNYYGNEAPDNLEIHWKHYLGEGITVISRAKGERKWKGAGWTGQPLLVEEDGVLYLIQGAYDHHLKKIRASDGEIVWQYKFDDVVKGTGSIWHNKNAQTKEEEWVILQGSRLGIGNYLDSKHIPSYRAISYITGKELWRLDVRWGPSYSRDVDGSALFINDTAYIGLENAYFTVFSPDWRKAKMKDGMLQPVIYEEHPLWEKGDVEKHKNNVVTESSPALLNHKIYSAAGSGHIYGYNLKTRELDWRFDIGSDIDGSTVVTRDGCILATCEKQYIKGNGGVFKLDPEKEGTEAVVWWFPTDSINFEGWEGGIIGSASVNDQYISYHEKSLASFIGLDGYLYVVSHEEIVDSIQNDGPNLKHKYPAPDLVFKYYVGPSISTPIMTGSKIIAATYDGFYLFEYDQKLNFKLLDKYTAAFESTPIVHNGKIYCASRDGYLYCFGK
ncbi:PQQ-binding-like beta-propeller repeat protein [Seonamhaeicola sp.]|uniref:PQQ-binding-like beta-propeller repeat protein n=1 Tax=Seonamhaeicola sp. TaxID=1912245 RepID=UPI0026223551|nr:PQQ-binding-like beta-propeller repeat protein [Seonamhaeicola sp.]